MESIGPDGERLALAAGDVTDIAVGWDGEFNSATFDSDDLEGAELEAVIFDALGNLNSEWREHLKVAE